MAEARVEVLRDLSLDVFCSEFMAVCGASGTGKTTLLNLISGIDKPTGGRVVVFGEDLTNKSEDFLSDFRCNKIGFVFQAYNLVSTLTVAENIAFPMEWSRKASKEIETRVSELLETLGMGHRLNHFPAQLSGGEQQRVALARALANDPPLLLADEPTGNLDAVNAQKIIDILRTLKEKGKTVIVSTHDERIIQFADQTFRLENGGLASRIV
ncbi:MAG TPA: ABC transporter ATP-binding protein [Candidatus Bathyarchaeia archaeon]|nr:ABC transporter ATP-binding protein [Candidatus Bathyarchaeia archaeon]